MAVWRGRLVILIVVALAGAAVPPTAAPAGAAASSCTPASGTLGGLQVLQHVTATSDSGNDTIAFEFATLGAPARVGATYTVSAASPPFLAGASGQPLAVGGQFFVKVSFHNAYLGDPVNTPPQATYAGPTDLKPGLAVLTQATVSDSFEGFLTWVLGLRQRACWSVQQLASPVRLVVALRPSAGALPVTGPAVPVVPLAALGLAVLLGGLAVRRRERAFRVPEKLRRKTV